MERLDFLMGTAVSQKAYGFLAGRATARAFAELKRLERLLSVFDPDSEVSRINSLSGVRPCGIGADIVAILSVALLVSKRSGGAFDVTVGPAQRLWSVTADEPKVPPASVLTERVRLVDYTDVVLDEARQTCYLRREGQALDLGGIAKGYAADRALEVYRQHGIRSAFVDIGGNVALLGQKPNGEPWNVGIQDPRDSRGVPLKVLQLSDVSAVTSGAYERGFMENGRWYHHIIDPRTGYPAETDLTSVTVVHKSSMLADALSTAIFVLGTDEGLRLLSEFEGAQAVLVTQDGSVVDVP